MTNLYQEKVYVIIFSLEKNKVIGVESIELEGQSKESILRWLDRKYINEIYVSEIDNQTLYKINLLGIQVRTLETLEDDKLYNSMILSSLKLETQ